MKKISIRLFSCIVLYPLSIVYRSVLALRRYCIMHYYRIYKTSIPVIAVGNIAVGGTGKTPITSHILSLCEQNNLSSTVISRGYGGNGRSYPIVIIQESNPIIVGDEPYMLAMKHPQACCIVDPKRKRAMEYALLQNHQDCFILDDGMQHIYVERDANIVILTLEDILNSWNAVLPYGRWREGKQALYDASIFCIRATDEEWQQYKDCIIKRLQCYNKPIYSFFIIIKGLYTLDNSSPTTIEGEYSIISGIGNPQFFYKSITKYIGYEPIEAVYCRDHATKEELYKAIKQCSLSTIICTEKDAVKLGKHVEDKNVMYAKISCFFGERLFTQESFDEYCLGIMMKKRVY